MCDTGTDVACSEVWTWGGFEVSQVFAGASFTSPGLTCLFDPEDRRRSSPHSLPVQSLGVKGRREPSLWCLGRRRRTRCRMMQGVHTQHRAVWMCLVFDLLRFFETHDFCSLVEHQRLSIGNVGLPQNQDSWIYEVRNSAPKVSGPRLLFTSLPHRRRHETGDMFTCIYLQ